MANLPLDNRKDFFEVLEQTRIEAEALAQRVPGFPPYRSITRQLEAMQSMTANGRTPTEDERDSISIGLIAVRELEPPKDEAMGDFIDRLHELNGYFREWPPT
jgi:hypothetical protein